MKVVAAMIHFTKNHASALVLFCTPMVASCFLQPIHNDAAVGSEPAVLPIEPGSQPDPGNGTIPPVTKTPPIYGFGLKDGYDGTSTDDACIHTSNQATALLTSFCAPCHALGDSSLGNPKFKDVLTPAKLVDPQTPTDMAGVPFIVPGYPERSRLFQRVSEGTMPSTTGDPRVKRKLTVSEISVIEYWIASCLGVKRPTASPPNGSTTTTSTTTGGATTGATTTGGATTATGATVTSATATGATATGAGGYIGAGGASGGVGGSGGSGGLPTTDAGAAGGGAPPDGGGFMRDGGRRGGG